ncbi:MAG: hypothetical protein Q9M89_09675 [Persephonella sp.]|nr:hypothetical protein [Persephonella sp.]
MITLARKLFFSEGIIFRLRLHTKRFSVHQTYCDITQKIFVSLSSASVLKNKNFALWLRRKNYRAPLGDEPCKKFELRIKHYFNSYV